MSLWSRIAGDRPRWTSPPDEDDWRNARPNKYGKSPSELYGNVSHVDEYFQGNSTRPTPWGSSGSMGTKREHAYDIGLVHEALRQPTQLEDVDPRTLTATQPSIVRSAVQHYQDSDYHKTGKTFEPGFNKGNEHPTVYMRDDGTNFILSGHHRAAKALFAGHPLRARVVRGGTRPRE